MHCAEILYVDVTSSREQEMAAAGGRLPILGTRPHCPDPQQDAGPATWLSWLRMTPELSGPCVGGDSERHTYDGLMS